MTLPHGLQITWFGHSTFLVETPAKRRLLIEPWTHNNPACPENLKDPGSLDLILITHGHVDHMGDAVALAQSSGALTVASHEIVCWLATQGLPSDRLLSMNQGGSVSLPELGLTVTMTTALHSSGLEVAGVPMGAGGDPSGFIVTLDDGFAFYHAGDTALFSDMKLLSELYQPTLAMLPIGDRFTMGPREAAYACAFLASVTLVLPMHYATFPPLTGTPEQLRNELAKRGLATQVLAPLPGESITHQTV